jgi:hypothetical protein
MHPGGRRRWLRARGTGWKGSLRGRSGLVTRCAAGPGVRRSVRSRVCSWFTSFVSSWVLAVGPKPVSADGLSKPASGSLADLRPGETRPRLPTARTSPPARRTPQADNSDAEPDESGDDDERVHGCSDLPAPGVVPSPVRWTRSVGDSVGCSGSGPGIRVPGLLARVYPPVKRSTR